ncbi:hypothetical protein LguiA_015182 [Lonicera macranthoides]
MAEVLNLRPPPTLTLKPSASSNSRSNKGSPSSSSSSSCIRLFISSHHPNLQQSWTSLQHRLKCRQRVSCLFSGNHKQEQAKKALESALDGKKTEYEKWDKEMTRREEAGGGDDDGGGGWFGWRGWSGDDWQEAQRTSLTILGIFVMVERETHVSFIHLLCFCLPSQYLVIAKGDVMFAVIFNPLLFALRGTRTGLSFATSRILKIISPTTNFDNRPAVDDYTTRVSAKESVVKKWGSD